MAFGLQDVMGRGGAGSQPGFMPHGIARRGGFGMPMGGNKGAAQQIPDMRQDQAPAPQVPAAEQGFYQPTDLAGKAALLQAMIARSRAGYGA